MSQEFDIAAGERLHAQLSQLIAKLDWFVWLRATQRKALLGSPSSDNWQGARRKDFEGEYARQQMALNDLKAKAQRLQSSVAQATNAARVEQRNRN